MPEARPAGRTASAGAGTGAGAAAGANAAAQADARRDVERRFRWWLALASLVLLLDQATKELVERTFSFAERLPVLPGLFDLTLVYNRGAAFSFLAGASGWQRWFFTVLGLVAAVVIVWLLRRHATQKLFALGLALILGGALGNVIDRIVRGQVVDFLLVYWQQYHWPAFNVADSAITIGAALLIIDEFRRMRQAKRGG